MKVKQGYLGADIFCVTLTENEMDSLKQKSRIIGKSVEGTLELLIEITLLCETMEVQIGTKPNM